MLSAETVRLTTVIAKALLAKRLQCCKASGHKCKAASKVRPSLFGRRIESSLPLFALCVFVINQYGINKVKSNWILLSNPGILVKVTLCLFSTRPKNWRSSLVWTGPKVQEEALVAGCWTDLVSGSVSDFNQEHVSLWSASLEAGWVTTPGSVPTQ